jgi:hypothetical protein
MRQRIILNCPGATRRNSSGIRASDSAGPNSWAPKVEVLRSVRSTADRRRRRAPWHPRARPCRGTLAVVLAARPRFVLLQWPSHLNIRLSVFVYKFLLRSHVEAFVTSASASPSASPTAAFGRTRTIAFINCAHFADHFMLLVYATAVIVMAPEFGLSYGAGIALATGLFACFGCSRCRPAGSPTAGAGATCWRCSGSAAGLHDPHRARHDAPGSWSPR